MDNTLILTKNVESMDCFYGHVTSFVRTSVVIGKDTPIIRLDRSNAIPKHLDDCLKKDYGMMTRLLIVSL